MIHFLRLSFWGLFYFFLLVIGFKISAWDMVSEILLLKFPFFIFFSLFFVSFPIMIYEVARDIKRAVQDSDGIGKASLASLIYFNWRRYVMIPISGFQIDFKELARIKKDDIFHYEFKEALLIVLNRLFTTVCFWLISFLGIYSVVKIKQNIIIDAIGKLSQDRKNACVIGVLVFVIVNVGLIKVAERVWIKQLEDNDEKKKKEKAAERKQYFAQRFGGVPIGKLVSIAHRCRFGSTLTISEDGEVLKFTYRSNRGHQVYLATYRIEDGKLVLDSPGVRWPGQIETPWEKFLWRANSEFRFKNKKQK